VIFAATGVTDGSILPGIKREVGYLTAETILMRSKTGSVRRMTYRNPVSPLPGWGYDDRPDIDRVAHDPHIASLSGRRNLADRAPLGRPGRPRKSAWPSAGAAAGPGCPGGGAGLARRGVGGAAGLPRPVLRDLLPDPRAAEGHGAAAARLARRAVQAARADRDLCRLRRGWRRLGRAADRLARQMGHGATLYVPDRIDEGYGPNDAGDGGAGRGP
jgi:hypothetical protein